MIGKAITLDVSIVVPAYNEENGLGGVLTQLSAIQTQMSAAGERLRSSSWTMDRRTVRRRSRGSTTGITLIRHRVNRGYGASLKTGIRHAKGDWVCITDADGTYPNERIPELVERAMAGEFDMVVGRAHRGKCRDPAAPPPGQVGDRASWRTSSPESRSPI